MHAAAVRLLVVSGIVVLAASQAAAQSTPAPTQQPPATPPATTTPPAVTPPVAAQPAPSGQNLPPVEIIQQVPKKAPAVKKQAAPKKQAPLPVVQATTPPAEQVEAAEPNIGGGSLPAGTVRMSPIGNSEIPIAKVPGAVGTASASSFAREAIATPQNVLQTTVPGVIISDLQGNDFQTEVQYRGFSSSPVNGVPQGLAVYQNGVRINESFGDIVNWDFLPSNAIADITVMSGNPVFGLNAIGGSISIGMRDGFNFQGAELDFRAGSHGRIQGALAAGAQSGPFAAFLAVEGIEDDGWRDFSSSEIRRIYADLGFKNRQAEFHVNFTGADNSVGAVAASPVELLARGRELTFTSPQTTENELAMVSANGTVKLNETLSFSGITYYRHFKQRRIDGNIADFEECVDPAFADTLCFEDDGVEEQLIGMGSSPFLNPDGSISDDIEDNGPLGSLDRTSQNAKGYGGAIQAVEKARLFGLPNQFLVGMSYDHGRVNYMASSEVGNIGPKFVVTGSGITLIEPDAVAPRDLVTTNDYFGAYFSNTLDLTSRFAVTVGGRYNFARIKLEDQTGEAEELNGVNKYERFNPVVGATYKLLPGVSVYGGYSEANRAPTPAELACSNPDNPCLIESFLTDDPPLEQVVSHTWEAGLRGEIASWGQSQKFEWTLGLFRTLNTDDIIAIAAPQSGRGYFQNAGDTLRQGFEAGVNYKDERLFAYASYSFVDATYDSSLILPSPNTPSDQAFDCDDGPGNPVVGDDPKCIQVSPGDTLPGVPKHRFKAGFDYRITRQWLFGADVIVVGSQVFFGDDANLNERLDGYTRVNLHTSFDITKNIQIYGLVNNVFDKKYGLFGNYFDLEEASDAADGSITFTDPRTIVPAAPVSAYGGVKVKF